jgi:transient receptor potential cation channel subfamily A protein 1
MALVRIIMEIVQLMLQFPRYLLDEINWIEMTLFISSIIFVWVFHNDCLCPLKWQWQVGVVAVFLGWIALIVFISKLPQTGIYVLMFLNVFYTFLKVLLLSILLVLAFALTFYLAFTEPEITV